MITRAGLLRVTAVGLALSLIIGSTLNHASLIHLFQVFRAYGDMQFDFTSIIHQEVLPPPPAPVWGDQEFLQLENCVKPPSISSGKKKISIPLPSSINSTHLDNFCSSWLDMPEEALSFWRRTCRPDARCIVNTHLHDLFPLELCVLDPTNSSSLEERFLIRFPFVDPANVAHAIQDASVVITMKMLMDLPLHPKHCIVEIYETQKKNRSEYPGHRFIRQNVCSEVRTVEARLAQQRAHSLVAEEDLPVLQFAQYGFNFMWDGFYPPTGNYQIQGGFLLFLHHGYLDNCRDWSLPMLATEHMFCFMIGRQYPCRRNPSDAHILYIDRPPGDERRIRNSDKLLEALQATAPTLVLNGSTASSVESQAEAVGGARIVVGVHGAGMANIFWLSRASLVVEVIPWVKHLGHPRRFEGSCFRRQALARESQYTEILANPPKKDDLTKPFNFEATYTNPEVDIDLVVGRVKEYIAQL